MTPPRLLQVRAISCAATVGVVIAGGRVFRCALGRGGRRIGKHEGDGATPIGRWAVREVAWRADRGPRPRTRLASRAIRPADGWCDAAGDGCYNRLVRHPFRASAEHMWRADALYDVVVVLGYNDRPRRRGRGSAIFMHVARADLAPTAGCIALRVHDLRQLLAGLRGGAWVHVHG